MATAGKKAVRSSKKAVAPIVGKKKVAVEPIKEKTAAELKAEKRAAKRKRIEADPVRKARSDAHRSLQRDIEKILDPISATLKRTEDGRHVVTAKDGPRPNEFDDAVAGEICYRFATDAAMTLAKVQAEPRFPDLPTLYDWIRDHTIFAKAYARSREIQYDLKAELLECVASTPLLMTRTKTTNDRFGESVETQESDNIERSRLISDTCRWLLAKRSPKKYGVTPFEEGGEESLQELLGAFRERNRLLSKAAPDGD